MILKVMHDNGSTMFDNIRQVTRQEDATSRNDYRLDYSGRVHFFGGSVQELSEEEPALCVTIERGDDRFEKVLFPEFTAYLMNDDGKTIDRL